MTIDGRVRLLTQPDYLLTSIDVANSEFVYHPISRSLVNTNRFLVKGIRAPGSSDTFRIDVDTALDWARSNPEPHSARMIFHTSFCGSTLLANILSGAGNATCYREPDFLSDLASLKAAKSPLLESRGRWHEIIAFAVMQFQKSWKSETVFTKASNWANPIIPDLMEALPDLRLLTISMNLEDYLIANLRGGKSRLAWSLELLNHLLACGQVNRCQVLEVERAGLNSVQRLLRLLIILHDSQVNFLDRHLESYARLGFTELTSAPLSSIHRGAHALSMRLHSENITPTLSTELSRHSKAASQPFSPQEEAAENARLYTEIGDELFAALDWQRERYRETG